MLKASRVARALALSLCAFTASPAFAVGGAAEKAAAEVLFDHALRLMKSGDYAAACPKLETSQRVDPAVGTLLYLGECYERLGRTASAWATFREAASSAQASGQNDRAKTAQARAARIEPELGYLSIEVPPDVRKIPGIVVRRSGAAVPLDLFGVAAPADPGEIEIEAAAPGYATFTTRATIVARGTGRISVPPLAKVPEAGPVSAPTWPKRSAEPRSSAFPTTLTRQTPVAVREDPLRPLAYVLGGVGIVGVGLGSYFGLRAISRNTDAEKTCKDTRCTPEGLKLTNEAEDAALISNVAFGLGASALAGGIIVFALTPPRREAAVLSVMPLFGRHGAAIALHGRL